MQIASMDGVHSAAIHVSVWHAPQALHADWPAASWYCPLPQSAHATCPVEDEKVPAPQYVGAVEPVAHAEPAGHAVQSLEEDRPAEFE